jgi:hypothetical protein
VKFVCNVEHVLDSFSVERRVNPVNPGINGLYPVRLDPQRFSKPVWEFETKKLESGKLLSQPLFAIIPSRVVLHRVKLINELDLGNCAVASDTQDSGLLSQGSNR